MSERRLSRQGVLDYIAYLEEHGTPEDVAKAKAILDNPRITDPL